MENFDGAELCQLVGLWARSMEQHRIGLYSDDWLAFSKYVGRSQAERIREDLIKNFKEYFYLSITCEKNLKAVIFLEVTLNLRTAKQQSYNKPDNNSLYINIMSNHLPNINKNFPRNISERSSNLSADETIFNKPKYLNQNTLAESGFKHRTTF